VVRCSVVRPPTHLDTATNLAQEDGWSAGARGQRGIKGAPRLRLLYHSDLSRLGAVSLPGVVPESGASITVGRAEPSFALVAKDAPAMPLDDPQVSREQLRLRWLAAEQLYEVEPVASAKRPLVRVDLGAPGRPPAAVTPITGPTRLPPGACIAIGDRVLLGLELADTRPPGADRMGLVGESEAVWTLRDEIRSVARFGRPALVNGPTGSGKELVARALHTHSARAAGPFVPVNCAALPDKLAESALFGHKKGAFTGADTEERGLFRAADGGTLFFDELGELPLSVQPKLLRVLQDGVVVPVGAHEGRQVDVRVIAATHRDLEAQVRAGGLREDLYHRVAGHVLRVPPLADRRFDVPELFVHVLARLRADHGSLGWLWASAEQWRPAVPIAFLAELLGRSFRGNVRELQNLTERTARLNLQPGTFHTADTPSVRSETFTPVKQARDPSDAPSDPRVPEALLRVAGDALGLAHKTVLKLLAPGVLVAFTSEAEKSGYDDATRAAKLRAVASDALFALLDAHDHNQSGVAAALGTSRTTLLKLMDDLGLPRASDFGLEEIARARAEAGDDLDAAARLLRVSPNALKRRLTLLNLKSRS